MNTNRGLERWRHRVLAGLLSVLLCLFGLTEQAFAQANASGEDDLDARRTVAVLGFRAGSDELPSIDIRLAELLIEITSLDVIDAVQARRRYGNNIDGAVVDCGGSAECIAKIGRELGAAEVLLVGVSRFGDVILTLQRVDTEAEVVHARIADAMAPGSQPSQEQLDSYLRRLMPENDFRRYGVIRIEANIAGATIYLGEDRRGVTPLSPLKVLAPSEYDIRVSKDGFVPFEVQASVPPNGEILVRAVLSERQGSWYTRWWLWALVGTTAIAAGVGTGLYLQREQDVPIVITPTPSQ